MLKKRNKQLLALLLSTELAAGLLAGVLPASADAAAVTNGTPYDTNGYKVQVPHVIINQYFGGGTSSGAAVSHGFIELYNPTDSNVDLSSWSIQYADRGASSSNTTEPTGAWEKLDLSGTINAHSSYLIRANATTASVNKVVIADGDFDLNFPRTLQNKGMKLVLMSNQDLLDKDVSVNPFVNKPTGYVDMLGTGSNDNGSTISGFESEFPAGPAVGSGVVGTTGGTSKNMSLRRVNFADSDNNKSDFVQIIFGSMTAGQAELTTYGPRSANDGEWGVVPTPLVVSTNELADGTATKAYSAKINVTGGKSPYHFSATGLPAGLAIDAATGDISGSPASDAPASNNVEVTITDSASTPQTTSKPYVLLVNQPINDTLTMTRLGSFIAGEPNGDGGVAEIVRYNPENHKFYSVNGSSDPATLDIVSLDNTGKPEANATSINIEEVVSDHLPDFEYGDFTSVDIDLKNDLVYAAIQEKTYTNNGAILVFDYDGKYVTSYEAGVQPDMIKVTHDGRYVLTADEAEPRLAGADPEGSVTIVDRVNNVTKHVKFDDVSVIDDLVHLRGTANEAGLITGPAASKEAAKYDLEPEYIALSADEKTAYVSLQEANAIATIDIASGTVTSVKGLGYKDLNVEVNSLDLVKDSKIKFENVPFKGMFMPDGIDTYTVDGDTYLFTANEGDATEWPGRTNISTIGGLKAGLTSTSDAAIFLAGKTVSGKTAYDGVEVPSDMGPDGIYLYGGRSFSIWNADSLEPVFDSKNDFEKITAQRLPKYFNSDHKEVAFDKRSTKKGPEPEYVKVGKVGSKALAFIGLERVGGIMAYDVTDPKNPTFVNYTNTRNFESNSLQGDIGPEGLEFIPATASPSGMPLLLVAHEVGGMITVYQLNVDKVTLNQKTVSLKVGGSTAQLEATVVPVGEGASTVTWSSSDDTVAKVDATGKVSPIQAGTAVITALSADGYGVAEAAVTVASADAPPSSPNTGPTTPPATGPVVDGTKVTTEVKAVTDASGKATAVVTDKQVEEVLSKLSASNSASVKDIVAIKATADAAAKETAVTFSAAAMDKISGSGADALVIESGIGQVQLDKKAMSTVANAASSGAVTVSVAKVSASDLAALTKNNQAAIAEAIGSHPVYDFSVMADGKKVSDFAGGIVNISIPYVLGAGEDANAIIAYYIADNGNIELVPNAKYDKATGQLTFSVTHFSTYAIASNNVKYSDTASSFAKDQITYLSARKIMEGVGGGSFAPKKQVTRADFTLILARVAGVDLTTYEGSKFSDVSADAYYAQSVQWAAATGITSGAAEGVFNPNAPITREQMVAMIARLAATLHYTLPKTVASVTFTDASSISAYAQDAVSAVQQAGIINGRASAGAGSSFDPQQLATREETAKMISVLFQGMMKHE
ncbi:choice-of-anchor I family protein [Paenibacillus sp. CF384]|uniref:choice-of-anchor I family protein n=1 Tax=Paenibacillus sp. CF384 TaxID=1884382 RepID=UPI000897ED21|nr:choice-of-anchor I family protein [Paenibacillus sp. CF384]SDW72515.1 S-layer homology domain-containing protein [Paenibacillus sp. CF384]